MLKRGN